VAETDQALEVGRELADHVSESVDAIARVHEEHYQSASTLQRAFDGVTERLARPMFVALLVAGLAGWIGFALLRAGDNLADPAFAWLELAGTLIALVVAMLILVTQRRQDRLSERRAQLTLELAVLADRKNAKIISLLEELRRDAPGLRDRHDAESAEMAKPADPETVLAALDERAAASGGAQKPVG